MAHPGKMVFGRKLPFWGPKFPLNFEKIETKNLMSQGKQLQPLMKAAHRQQVVPLSLLFLAQEITHLPQLSHHSLFFTINRIHMGKENQQQIPQDFENLFHQRKNGRFFFPTKKNTRHADPQKNNNILPPCLSKIDLFLKLLAFWQPKKRAAKKVATKTDILKEPPCCRAGRLVYFNQQKQVRLGSNYPYLPVESCTSIFPTTKT